jgi:L-lactate dehydrogenase complex protein LldE
MKVSLFSTCLGDQLYPQVAASAARILMRLGCEVATADSPPCCGQPAWNSGYVPEARQIARRLVAAFAEAAHVVSPSGSCCGMIHHYYAELFKGDPGLQREALAVIEKVKELSQFMVGVLGVDKLPGSFPHRVTYHPSCHGSRLLGARSEPLQLLRGIADLELVPLEHAEDCCGFGGTFAIKLSSISLAMVDEKAASIAKTNARYLVSTDLGCLMNISGRMRAQGTNVEALHLAELVDRALQAGTGAS